MVSVLVAVYNVEDYLPRCLDSVLNQTYLDLEVILVDDGSTDSSGSICEEYAKRDERVKVIHQVNEGLSSARNAGLRATTGDYILMIDGDDALHPQMIEILYNLIKSGNYDFSMCYWENIYDLSIIELKSKEGFAIDNKAVIELSSDSCIRDLFLGKPGMHYNYSVVWNKLYKKELINKCLFKSLPSKDVAQGMEFNNRIYLRMNTAIYSPLPLYFYTQRSTSFQHQGINLRYVDLIKTIYVCLSEIPMSQVKYRGYCLLYLWYKMYGRSYWTRKTSFYQVALKNQKHYCKATINEFLSNPFIPFWEKISLILLNYFPLLSRGYIGMAEWIAKIKKCMK
ncbi:MAG: glycosyltransferase family 2 protein [Bacteroidaceae bacterium]|nr:glycosyltransferase family 2 protein [Bacteroidaceae bacterium]